MFGDKSRFIFVCRFSILYFRNRFLSHMSIKNRYLKFKYNFYNFKILEVVQNRLLLGLSTVKVAIFFDILVVCFLQERSFFFKNNGTNFSRSNFLIEKKNSEKVLIRPLVMIFGCLRVAAKIRAV